MNVRRAIGTRVACGPYWEWDPGAGTVVGHDPDTASHVLVRWDDDGSTWPVNDQYLTDLECSNVEIEGAPF